jgi:hypothetical protein
MKLARRWEAVSDWLNTDIRVRRIDIALWAFGILSVTYYGYFYDLKTALAGGLLYLMILLICVWMI